MAYLRFRHPGGQILENVIYGNTKASDTRLPASFAGFNGDYLLVVHNQNLRCAVERVKFVNAPKIGMITVCQSVDLLAAPDEHLGQFWANGAN